MEQLLVRVLRQPETRRRQNLALNQSYTFVVSRDFSETARTLRDRLVEGAGFERREAAEFVTAAKKEEFDCAVWLDRQAQQGRIEFWVRNLVRKEGCSFFLQKADGRFYPDFICKLPDGVILAVEYKGADRWAAAEEDRLLGGLWEALSGGRCRFAMIRDRNWAWIDEKLAPKTPGSAGVPAGLLESLGAPASPPAC